MLIQDYDYELPTDLIAQEPVVDRTSSRMLIVNKGPKSFSDDYFVNLPARLKRETVLVLNNTKVFPARLIGNSLSGARIEIFLVDKTESGTWRALARPARRLRPGTTVCFSDGLECVVQNKDVDGKVELQFAAVENLDDVIDRIGKTPLPPYIKRDNHSNDGASLDRDRYQTVFAKHRGSIAAPTAGLHFTSKILDEVRQAGVIVVEITLHVGYGTFQPVRVTDISEHTVTSESYSIDENAAENLNRANRDRHPIVAVGTTTTRSLEHVFSKHGRFVAGQGNADLTIRPGYRFRAIGGLLTNFHLPKSSLIILTSTFGGHDLIMRAYNHAVSKRYRFYSYGDCMLIN